LNASISFSENYLSEYEQTDRALAIYSSASARKISGEQELPKFPNKAICSPNFFLDFEKHSLKLRN